MTAQKQYELVYILSPEATEEQVQEVHRLVEGIVSRFQGTLDRTDVWGRRKLAYRLGPHREAIYVVQVLSGGGDLVKEIDRRLKVNDLALRHLIVRVDEDLERAARAKAKREAETTRRRTARGLPAHPVPGEGGMASAMELDETAHGADKAEA